MMRVNNQYSIVKRRFSGLFVYCLLFIDHLNTDKLVSHRG
jgi:hypothetical protein